MNHFFIELFNKYVLLFFVYIYNTFKIESIEDRYHKDKQNTQMNKIKCEFKTKEDYEKIKANTTNIINDDFLNKYEITNESILKCLNNKLGFCFNDATNTINILFNHYYMGGSIIFQIFNKIFDAPEPTLLTTNPYLGLINLPFYVYDMFQLKKKNYKKLSTMQTHFINETNITVTNKRYYVYLSTLQKIFKSLNLDRPMVVALSVGFNEVSYIKNNVGIIIINYEISDTIETLEQKIKKAGYQAYVSNFILNCPLPNIRSLEIRNYVDCILTSIYLYSDMDIKCGWNCATFPTEELYAGTISILKSDNKMDLNTVFSTYSNNYNNTDNYINNFFE